MVVGWGPDSTCAPAGRPVTANTRGHRPLSAPETKHITPAYYIRVFTNGHWFPPAFSNHQPDEISHVPLEQLAKKLSYIRAKCLSTDHRQASSGEGLSLLRPALRFHQVKLPYRAFQCSPETCSVFFSFSSLAPRPLPSFHITPSSKQRTVHERKKKIKKKRDKKHPIKAVRRGLSILVLAHAIPFHLNTMSPGGGERIPLVFVSNQRCTMGKRGRLYLCLIKERNHAVFVCRAQAKPK